MKSSTAREIRILQEYYYHSWETKYNSPVAQQW